MDILQRRVQGRQRTEQKLKILRNQICGTSARPSPTSPFVSKHLKGMLQPNLIPAISNTNRYVDEAVLDFQQDFNRLATDPSALTSPMVKANKEAIRATGQQPAKKSMATRRATRATDSPVLPKLKIEKNLESTLQRQATSTRRATVGEGGLADLFK